MDELKIGIIGAGVWGETHAAIYRELPRVKVTAVCDLDTDKATHAATKLGLEADAVFGDYHAMLVHAEVDAVSIVTPDFLHRDAAVACADAGKHMLIEKPLATERGDLTDIASAIERNGVRVMVDLHNRWSPPFAVMKQSLDAGDIGEPWSAYFRLNDRQWVATNMLPWAAQSSILWFLGTHSVDTLRWVFNDEVKRVYCASRKGILAAKGVDTEDVFQTILEFQRGGIATMENGWVTPDTHPCINDIRFNLVGTKGMFNLDLSNSSLIERYTEEKVDHPDVLVKQFVHGKATGFSYESIRHFAECLLDGKEFLVSLKDAIHDTLVILAVLESAKTGQPVEVSY